MSSDNTYPVRTQLIHAVHDNDIRRVKDLVGSYGLYCAEAKGYVLLRDAVKDNYMEVAKYLLSMGCNVNSMTSRIYPTETPLHFAVSYHPNIEVIELLLNRGANIDAVNAFGETPLQMAIDKSNFRIVELLLSKGADVHKKIKGTTYLNIGVDKMKPNEKIIDLLLSKGADVNAKDEHDVAPLHLAAGNGNLSVVKLLVKCGASVNTYTLSSHRSVTSYPSTVKSGVTSVPDYTPLHLATLYGTDCVVKFLLDNGANIDAQDKDGKTALNLAVEKGNNAITELILSYHPDINNTGNKNVLVDAVVITPKDSTIVQRLLDYGFSIDAHHKSDINLLNAAVEKGYLKIVDDLIKLGADVNTIVENNKGFSLLHIAVKNEKKELCELLLENKVDVNTKDNEDKSSIFYAIENGDLSITKLLFRYGANLKYTSNLIEAFNTAVEKECLEIIELILQHDEHFDINTTDRSGKTPLHCTALSRNGDLTYCPFGRYRFGKKYSNDSIKASIAKLLLNKGADVNIRRKGFTTLFVAARNGFKKVVETLLEYNVDVDALQSDGRCALYVAASEGHSEVVEILLKSGCDINVIVNSNNTENWYATSHESYTSLHIAAKNGYQNIVKILLRYHANFMLKNEHGKTALHFACRNGHRNIVKILLNVGADVNEVDMLGLTALHIASQYGHLDCINILLKYGSDVNIIMRRGLTPLGSAEMGSNGFVYSVIPMFNTLSYGFVENQGINRCREVIKLLKDYCITLKAADLYLCDENNNAVCDLMDIDSFQGRRCIKTEHNLFYSKCLDELNIMKSYFIVSDISFHKIISSSIHQLAVFAKNGCFVQSFNSFDCKKMFPIYSDIINNRFKMGIKRKELLEECRRFIYSDVSSDLTRLPYIFVEMVFSNLSNDHLNILIDACSPSN